MSFIVSAATGIVRGLYGTVFGTHTATTPTHLTILHSAHLIFYQGSDTYVPLTVLKRVHGKGKQSSARSEGGVEATLVRRGWRAGFFGWAVAKYLGAKTVKGIDVTPVTEHGRANSQSALDGASGGSQVKIRTSFSERKLESYEKESKRFIADYQQTQASAEEASGSNGSKEQLVPVATHFVRIPAKAQDGYFRVVLRYPDGAMAISPDFRIYSFSLSSACPRGAALFPPTIAPELVIRAVSTALYTLLLGLFPVASILQKVLPKKWSRSMMQWAYHKVGADEKAEKMMQKYQVQEKLSTAKTGVLETVPFSGAGIRTDYDLAKDEEYGRGGVTYWR